MAYELKWTDQNSPDGTDFNDFPKGWREITYAEYLQSMFFSAVPQRVESRQMYDKTNPNWHMTRHTGGWLYWFRDGSGIALCQTYERATPEKGYEYGLKYFAFGCQHTYVGLSQQTCHERNIYHAGRCFSVSECSKCGHIVSVDSSD